MHNPQISIIVPVYNSETSLNTCINSILQQDYHSWELILIDDGSHDNSYKICKQYEINHNNITILRQNHKGVSAARNYGIESAKGEFICFIDSDDKIEPNYLSLLYSFHNYEMVICGYFVNLYDDNKKIIRKESHIPYNIEIKNIENRLNIANLFLQGMININCNKLIKTSILKEYNIRYKNYPINEDYIFMIEYLSHCTSIKTIEIPLYHWNIIINKKGGVASIPPNILNIYNEAHILTREFFLNNSIADIVLYHSYTLIVIKYFDCINKKESTHKDVFNQLKLFHKNPLIKASYHAYKPKNKGERIIHEIQKRGYFKLYYFLRQTILKWIS